MSDQEIQSVPWYQEMESHRSRFEPPSDDVKITISPDSSNSMSEHERMNSQQWTLRQAAAFIRYFMSFTQGRTLSDRERWNALRQAAATGRLFMYGTQGRAMSDWERLNALRQVAATASSFPGHSLFMYGTQGRTLSDWEGWNVAMNIQRTLRQWNVPMNIQGTLHQAAATGSSFPRHSLFMYGTQGRTLSDWEGWNVAMNIQRTLRQWNVPMNIQGTLQAAATGSSFPGHSLFMYGTQGRTLSDWEGWNVAMNIQRTLRQWNVPMNIQGTLHQAAATGRSLGDNIAVIGLIGATSAWLYGILFQLADKMHGSFFSHHRGMAMISGASMVYAAFSAVFLCVIFFLATADPTKTYRKRMRFLWGTYFYAACCGPAVLLMAMIDPSFGYKVLAWAVLGALFTPVGLYIGGYY